MEPRSGGGGVGMTASLVAAPCIDRHQSSQARKASANLAEIVKVVFIRVILCFLVRSMENAPAVAGGGKTGNDLLKGAFGSVFLIMRSSAGTGYFCRSVSRHRHVLAGCG